MGWICSQETAVQTEQRTITTCRQIVKHVDSLSVALGSSTSFRGSPTLQAVQPPLITWSGPLVSIILCRRAEVQLLSQLRLRLSWHKRPAGCAGPSPPETHHEACLQGQINWVDAEGPVDHARHAPAQRGDVTLHLTQVCTATTQLFRVRS
jgi:hypothetical protein